MTIRALALSLALAPAALADPDTFILQYGNSYTYAQGGTRSVPSLVATVAQAAGRNRPQAVTYEQTPSWTLQLNYIRDVGIDAYGFNPFPGPPVSRWNYVVLQGMSMEATDIPNGNPNGFCAYAGLLVDRVRQRGSTNVQPIMYRTWARGVGSDVYTAANLRFPGGPEQMDRQIRNSYESCAAHIGATVAPVGAAFKLAGWRDLYYTDFSHANSRGWGLVACVIYTTIYRQPVSNIDLTPLRQVLGLTPSDITMIKDLSDRATFHLFCPSDFNQDGSIDPDDLSDFITSFFSVEPIADFNKDGEVDPDDLSDYVTAFFTTCP